MTAQTDGTQLGLVTAVRPRRVSVRVGDHELVCDVRRGLLQGARKERNLLVVGDRVRVGDVAGDQAVLREILPRETKLSRLGSVRPRREHVIAANVDQLLALQSVDEPPFNARSLDRFLVMGEAGGVGCALGLNKIDLEGDTALVEMMRIYARAGYPVHKFCALHGDGVAELERYLTGKVTILLGPSGVGKSTLLNRLVPGLQQRTAEVSAATGRGVHTTARVDYIELPGSGVVLDTPGLRAVQPWVAPEDLADMFPDMRPHLDRCRFRDCRHRTEPGCAVRAAVAEGAIAAVRHESYVRILEGLLSDESANLGDVRS